MADLVGDRAEQADDDRPVHGGGGYRSPAERSRQISRYGQPENAWRVASGNRPSLASTAITWWPSSARWAAWRPVPQAASSATPGGMSASMACTIGCSAAIAGFRPSYRGAHSV